MVATENICDTVVKLIDKLKKKQEVFWIIFGAYYLNTNSLCQETFIFPIYSLFFTHFF